MKEITATNRWGERVTITVGKSIGFKSDIEQYATVTKIEAAGIHGGYRITVRNPDGFQGEYLRGAKSTVLHSEECFA